MLVQLGVLSVWWVLVLHGRSSVLRFHAYNVMKAPLFLYRRL